MTEGFAHLAHLLQQNIASAPPLEVSTRGDSFSFTSKTSQPKIKTEEGGASKPNTQTMGEGGGEEAGGITFTRILQNHPRAKA